MKVFNIYFDEMIEFPWGIIWRTKQIGLAISWGESVIPRKRYICIELPFCTIQIYTTKLADND